jgi:DNA polymerase-3 subunit chi
VTTAVEGAPEGSPGGVPQSVDFYVLASTDAKERLRLACRLAEKAYLSSAHVLVWSDDATELSAFDDLLWTFADRSFVPHEPYQEPEQWQEVPVLLSGPNDPAPDRPFSVLLNLGGVVPGCAGQAERILEIIDADENRRQAGRARFRSYRERGLAPQTHHINGGPSS